MFISLIISQASGEYRPPGCEPVCQILLYVQLRHEVSRKDCIKCLCVREENNTTLHLVAGRGLFSGVWTDQMTPCFQF